MTKNVLMKKRSWDENIWKLIVFAVTIIIAVGVLGTLAYFYNQSRKNATNLSILTSTTSSASDLTGLNFCSSDSINAHVTYTPISDEYTLTCTWWTSSTVDDTNIKAVRGIVNVTKDTNGYEATYKVNK